jgi:VWFA-related protein
MNKLASTVFFLLFLIFPAILFSQTPSSTPPETVDKDVVRISTNLIQIDATVLDKNGKIVTGLTADDFEIYENGRKQPITNFSFVEPQPDKSPAQPIVKPNKNSIIVPSTPNRLRPEQVRRTIALVVDDLDLSMVSMDIVKSSLKKYVDEQVQPGDLVAIIRTSGGGGFLQQYTSDRRILYKAVEKMKWNPAGTGGISVFTPSDPSDTNHAVSGTTAGDLAIANNNKADDARQESFMLASLGAVNYVIKGMNELPGRKALVLFSEGFPLYSQDRYDAQNNIKRTNIRLMQQLRRLVDTANRSSVIIYGVDTRGLLVPMPEAGDNVSPTGGGGLNSQQLTTERFNTLFENQQGLEYLSEQTGGFAIINNNKLNRGIDRILNDQKGYYLIGYQPDDETFDPQKVRFNNLTVKLKRPDLQVRYRSGFFGVKDKEAAPQAQTPQQQILNALISPLNSSKIDLQLTSLFANDVQTGNFMRSVIYVNGNDLKFTEDTGGWEKATFDVVAMIFGENGNLIDQISRTETIKARAETLQELRKKGFVSTLTFPIKNPGAYQMRVVLRDTATSELGSASQFIEVPNLKKNRLTLSGIVLQRVRSQADNYQNVSAVKQFQSDEERDVATRSFRAGTNVRFGYAIYNANSTDTGKTSNLKTQFRIFKDGKEIFASREKSVNLVEQTDVKRLIAEGVFTLGKEIQPGDYVLQIIVRDMAVKEKNQIATQWIDFEVIP